MNITHFVGAIHISGMAEARIVKFCPQGDHVREMINQKARRAYITHFAFAVVYLEIFCDGTLLSEVNNDVDG